MFSSKSLFVAATCLSLNGYAATGPTYKGLYDCTFVKAQFKIAHNNMDTRFSLLLKWPNGADELLTNYEEEIGPIGNDVGTLIWTTSNPALGEMTFRTDLFGAAPDEITVFVQDQSNTCHLIERGTSHS